MRIYDRIMSDGYITTPQHIRVKEPVAALRAWNCQRVICDNTAEWYWRSLKNVWDIGGDTGPLRLPFDHMWFEWRIPDRVIADNGVEGVSPFAAGAVIASRHKPGPEMPPEVVDVILCHLIATLREQPSVVRVVPVTGFIGVNENGDFVQHEILSGAPRTADPHMSDVFNMAVMPALIAIGLMNCKNTTVDKIPAAPMNRAQKRRGEARYSYHVIHVPSEPKVTTRANIRAAAGPPKAFHLVRGHFKTYTAEHPLFGTKTGTYWWSWHGRGDTKAGVALHDYTTDPQ